VFKLFYVAVLVRIDADQITLIWSSSSSLSYQGSGWGWEVGKEVKWPITNSSRTEADLPRVFDTRFLDIRPISELNEQISLERYPINASPE